jgi:hypothetical protein
MDQLEQIKGALDAQIAEYERTGKVTPYNGQKIINALGGSFQIRWDTNTEATCVYMTALAIKKMFELNNGLQKPDCIEKR